MGKKKNAHEESSKKSKGNIIKHQSSRDEDVEVSSSTSENIGVISPDTLTRVRPAIRLAVGVDPDKPLVIEKIKASRRTKGQQQQGLPANESLDRQTSSSPPWGFTVGCPARDLSLKIISTDAEQPPNEFPRTVRMQMIRDSTPDQVVREWSGTVRDVDDMARRIADMIGVIYRSGWPEPQTVDMVHVYKGETQVADQKTVASRIAALKEQTTGTGAVDKGKSADNSHKIAHDAEHDNSDPKDIVQQAMEAFKRAVNDEMKGRATFGPIRNTDVGTYELVASCPKEGEEIETEYPARKIQVTAEKKSSNLVLALQTLIRSQQPGPQCTYEAGRFVTFNYTGEEQIRDRLGPLMD